MTTIAKGAFFIGLGNASRRDGGVGIWLANALAARGIGAIALSRNDAMLIEALDTHSDVVLLDATQSGHPPGRITRFNAGEGPVPSEIFRHPSGSLGASEVVETARSLGCLPPNLMMIGIEGQDFSHGSGLSPRVEWAAYDLLREILAQRG